MLGNLCFQFIAQAWVRDGALVPTPIDLRLKLKLNMLKVTEKYTIDVGQKDVLLRGANI